MGCGACGDALMCDGKTARCDACWMWFHLKCAGIKSIPATDWHCKKCREKNDAKDEELNVLKQLLVNQSKMLDNLMKEKEKSAGFYKRQCLQKLPTFSGAIGEWPRFKAIFDKTTEEGGYDDMENCNRLLECLKKPARDLVEVKLTNPDNLKDVLKYLEQVYGNPRRIYDQLMNDVITVRPPREGSKDSYLEFGTKLSNLVCNLEMLKMTDRLKDPRLISDLLKRMSLGQQEKWFEYVIGKDENDLSVFNEFIQARISVLMNLHYNNEARHIPTKGSLHLQSAGEDYIAANVTNPPAQCLVCNESTKHHLSECKVFNDMSVNDRWDQVKSLKLCFGCLNRVKHQLNQCQSARECGVNDCKRKHHSLLHQTIRNYTEPVPGTHSSFVGTHQENVDSDEQPLFMILPVTVSANNVNIDTFAFLDTGSSFTLMESEIAQQLGLTGTPEKFGMVTTKGRLAIEEDSLRTSCEISGRNSKKQYKLRDVRTGNNWGFPVGTLDPSLLVSKFPHLLGLPLPRFFNAVPKILIGTNNQSLLSYHCVVENSDTEPIAVKTKLGWSVFGKSHLDGVDRGYIFQINQWSPEAHSEIDCEIVQQDNHGDDSLHDLVRNFFTTENFGCKPKLNDKKNLEDERVKKIISNTLKRIDGRYEVGLLWKNDADQLPDSYNMALKRLTYVEARMKKDAELANWYTEEINAYLRKGYCRRLNNEEINAPWPRIWYIPFFHVINPNKTPRKIRLVFDAAAKVGRTSLNSKLLTGPNIYASMPGVIFKFREGKYCVAADIREMFPQVKIKETDQHAQRFLWRGGDTNREPDIFMMTSMIFGASCSPFLAQLVKNNNALKYISEFPEAVDAIHNQHFVDDYLNSHGTIDQAITIAKQVIHIHLEAGFELRNFVSNSREILSALPQSTSIVKEISMNWETENVTEKILGVFWNINHDVFEIKLNCRKIPNDILTLKRPPTKRELLRIVMSIFDPIGMLSHALIRPKVIIQETWRSKIDWDQSLTDKLFAKWVSWFRSFLELSDLTIPRVYSGAISTASEIQMHTFVDASEYAFAAVVYFRITYSDRVECSLVTSKAKVAPNKVLTIPRLELQAALLGSRLADFVRQEHRLKINKQWFWSDSKTTLSWILCTDLQSLKPFVGVRVSEIHELSHPNEWRKVPTKLNVADDATKWSETTLFHTNSRWFKGPEFLYQPEFEWPDYDYQQLPAPLETRAPVFSLKPLDISFTAVPIDRFSSYVKLVRVVAYMLRFLKNCQRNIKFNIQEKQQTLRFKSSIPNEIPTIDSQEHQAAELLIIRATQFQSFSEEYVALMGGIELSKKSCLFPLTPIMDNNKIIRLNSRIKKAPNISYSQMMPAILPNKHPVVELIVTHHHQIFLHQFQEAVIASIRKKFWIIHVRQAVRRIKANCQQCKNKRAQPLPTLMGELPLCRLQSGGKPFQHTGMDFFGPLHATIFRKSIKCYVFLFTCMVTRGIHIELVLSLSADDCIMNIRNFLNRRGPTQHFYCDNGTNFHGAHRELLREIEKMSPQLVTSNDDYILTWHFNPPGASHFGGAFERLNLSVQRALDVVMSHQKPKLETLRTALIECENIINSRPLTHIPLDSEDEAPITPNNFLKLHVNQLPAPGEFSSDDLCSRKQWRIAQFIANDFWRKWRTYYLPELTRRSKWFEKAPNLVVGDIVLLVDNCAPRNEWRKGRIVELIPGTDGVVRVVAVSCNNKIYTRPILKLAKLDVQPKMK